MTQPNDRPWRGGPVNDLVTCVLAGNSGPMTLDGTNTWILHPPGCSEAAVIDPGPDDDAHLDKVFAVLRERDVRVAVALLTHGHSDHWDGALRLVELAGTVLRAADPRLCLAPGTQPEPEVLADGDVVSVGGVDLRVVATPGHTSDSLSFLLAEQRMLFAGDTVLGRGTSFVAHPDGALGPYLESLHRLHDLAADGGIELLLPGHGPVVTEPYDLIGYYLQHRAERLAQVRAAVAAGARTAGDVVAKVYYDVDPALWDAAERSVRAQMDYLASEVSRPHR